LLWISRCWAVIDGGLAEFAQNVDKLAMNVLEDAWMLRYRQVS
jgi:hypothetical protein